MGKIKLKTDKITALKAEISKYDAVVITGASSGIGKGFVEVLDKIAHLKLCNISRSFPSYLSDRKDFLNVPCDLQNSKEISAALPKIFGFLGWNGKADSAAPRIILINNAGFGAYGEFPEPSVGRNCDMIDLNCRAVARLCGEFAPLIIAGRGSIINIASTAAYQPCPQLATYAATKSFVKSFTLGISYELRQHGCKCLCICPGPTSSNFFRAAGFETPPLPSGFGHQPEDVALAAINALSRGKTITVVGFLNKVQTTLARFVPTRILLAVTGVILKRIRTVR